MAKPRLADILSDAYLRDCAGKPAFKRGVAYARGGRVRIINAGAGTFTAQVNGTEAYTVTISGGSDYVNSSCDCYMGQHEFFCKHCVAAAIIWRERGENTADTMGNLRTFLHSQPVERLTDWLIERAIADEDFERRLSLTAAVSGGKPDLEALKRTVDDAMVLRHRIRWHEFEQVVSQIENVVAVINELMAAGHHAEVRTLCEQAIGHFNGLIEAGGRDNALRNLFGQFFELHLAACKQLKLRGKKLAATVLSFVLADNYGIFEAQRDGYFELLGTAGYKEFERLIEKRWANADGAARVQLSTLRLDAARKRGDVDAVVEILALDLSGGSGYVKIAEALQQAARHDEALQWLERGLDKFPTPGDWQLDRAAAEAYSQAGRHIDALGILWLMFEGSNSLDAFKTLDTYARTASESERWRDKAVGLLRKRLAHMPDQADHQATMLRTLLVEIFMHEQNFEMALAEVDTGPVMDVVLARLTDSITPSHPGRAKAFLLRTLKGALANSGDLHYSSVRETLLRLQPITDESEFTALLASIRTDYKRRGKLLALIRDIQ